MPDLDAFCTDLAVTVTVVIDETSGAVKTPADEIDPVLALQVTPELKLPVPITDAEQLLVCSDSIIDGEQVAVTDVMFDDPHPATKMRAPSINEIQIMLRIVIAQQSTVIVALTQRIPTVESARFLSDDKWVLEFVSHAELCSPMIRSRRSGFKALTWNAQ
ncbi:MAG: hypothetical protein ABSC64_18590 [Candidatus Korobacteraceae bacterium]